MSGMRRLVRRHGRHHRSYSEREARRRAPRGPAHPPASAVPPPEPPTALPDAVLELVVGDRAGPAFPLPTDRATTLGRSADADIPLGDRLVSRLHASVRLEPSGWTLRDLGSRNGTRLDGVTVASAQLHPGAVGRWRP